MSGLPTVEDVVTMFTSTELRAVLKIADEVGFVGAQEFARLSDEEAAAWDALVAAARAHVRARGGT